MGTQALRSVRSRVLPFVLSLVPCACGDPGGGGGGTPEPTSYWVYIDPSDTLVASSSIDLRGQASCEACPPTVTEFGGCPIVQGPFQSAVDILWSNHTTGQQGGAYHAISGHCACLFSYCWVSYEHAWFATVPLVMGPNVIEIVAIGPSDLPGSETVTVTRTPPAPTGVEARASAGEIELDWIPVALADSHAVYWSDTGEVSVATAQRVPDAPRPFRHLGLADDTTLYYAVAAVSGGQEGPLSAVAWATAGWPTETLPVPPGVSGYADTSVATDALGHTHVHLSRQDPGGASERNDYATDGSGTWVSTQVALTSWREADLALDSRGGVHLAYLGPAGLVHASGGPGSWSSEVVDAQAFCDASLGLDATDGLHLAYHVSTTTPEVRYASMYSGSWLAERVDAADSGCASGVSTLSLAVEGDGTPHLAYSGPAPGYALHYATRSGGGWVRETVDAGPIVRPSLGLAPDGTPNLAFVDGQGSLRLARREASGTWAVESVDEERWADTPSLVMDPTGKAHVSYFSSGRGGELRYATNAGGTWRVVRVAPATYSDTALALDDRGGIHIASFDAASARISTRR